MGKSPAKWIKSVLFGKKSRSATVKGLANEKDELVLRHKSLRELARDPTSDLHPKALNVDAGRNLDLDISTGNGVESSGISPATDVSKPLEQDELDIYKEDIAASKIQAAFKGYLARRAFQALRGIIRLQALIRGHLVRKQAVATLHCMQGIVRMQAIIRGIRVRRSDIGLAVSKLHKPEKTKGAKPLLSSKADASSVKNRPSTNAFVQQLPAHPGSTSALRIHYYRNEPNSAVNWLERWTLVRIWVPAPQPKKFTYGLPSHEIQPNGHHSVGSTQSGRSKRTSRKVNSANTVMLSSGHIASEDEKSKRNLRKLSTSPAVDQVREQPLSELEKVKRNLRKVSTSTVAATPTLPEAVSEKSRTSFKKLSDYPSDAANKNVEIHSNQVKTDRVEAGIPYAEVAALKPVTANVPSSKLQDQSLTTGDSSQPGGDTEFADATVANVNANVKDREISHGNQKLNKKKTSPKMDENGVPVTPTLPRYMAATQSAKAKLGQISPSSVSDGSDKKPITRGHSLPTTANGKVRSPSLRAQGQVHANGKSASKSERSLLSSRDGNERVIPEWRR